MKRLGMLQHLSMVALAAAVFAGCGDDDDTPTFDARPNIDAPITTQFDARPPDAAPADARPPDAPAADAAPTFGGTIALHDIELFGNAAAGHGVQVDISFTQSGLPTVASYPGPAFPPCSASVTDVTAVSAPEQDEGTVTFTVGGTGAPPCNFVAGEYRCLLGMGTSGTIATNAGNPAVGNLTPVGYTPMAAHVGSWILVSSGAAMGSAWPIVGTTATNVGIQNTGAAFPAAIGGFLVQYGVGPVALTAAPDGTGVGAAPELLPDDATVTVQYTPKSGAHFNAFTTPAIAVGDRFAPNAAMTDFLTNFDLAGTADVTIGCDPANCPDRTNPAVGTIVNIETTDVAGGGPTTLMPATGRRGNMTCSGINLEGTVTIPKEAIAVLNQANVKKMRISIFRDGFNQQPRVNVVVGHGHVAFQNK